MEETIVDGDGDIDYHKLESVGRGYGRGLEEISKLLPKESGLLFKKYMPQILEWLKNEMGEGWVDIHDSLFEVKRVLSNKDDFNTIQKMGIIDRLKDIQHSTGGIFGFSADLEKGILKNFVKDIPKNIREDYYPFEIQNKFFDYLTHGEFEKEWREQMENYSSKINWYKQAISESDFYDFYAISDFSENDFKNNPKLLVQVVEHLSYIRDYYLEYLIKEIGEELDHGLEGAIYNFWDRNENKELEKQREIERGNLKDLTRRMNSSQQNISSQDFKKSMYYFENYDWTTEYGGNLWGEIAKWTKKLYETQIFYEKPTKRLFDRIYKLIMIIDTIHSLEHNTNNVLADLPEREARWMKMALEIVKHSESASYFSSRMSNPKFQEETLRNKMLSQKRLDKFNKGPYRKIFEDFINKVKNDEYVSDNLSFSFSELLKEADSTEIEVFFDVMDGNAEFVHASIGRFRFDFILRQLSYNPQFYTKELLKKGLEVFDHYDTRNVYVNVLNESPVAPNNVLSILSKIQKEIN